MHDAFALKSAVPSKSRTIAKVDIASHVRLVAADTVGGGAMSSIQILMMLLETVKLVIKVISRMLACRSLDKQSCCNLESDADVEDILKRDEVTPRHPLLR